MSPRVTPWLALGFLLSTEALAYCRTTLSPAQPDPTVCPRGSPVAWPTSCVGLHIDPSLLPRAPEVITADEFRGALSGAMRVWSEADCGSGGRPSFRLLLLEDRPGGDIGYNLEGANINLLRFSSDWGTDSFHPPDAAAVTIVTFGSSSARILDTDTEFNLRSAANPGGAQFSLQGLSTASDLVTIATHELGHTQGLAHASLPTSVMWFTAGRGEQRRSLSDDDAAGLCAVYPPRAEVICDPTLRGFNYTGGGCSCMTEYVHSGAECCLGILALVCLQRRRVREGREGH